MGYGFYILGGRAKGYMVLATCDRRGCRADIDRGLGFLCGDSPHELYSDDPGCGRYYCDKHLGYVGPRGGCFHRGKIAWGQNLSCMAESVAVLGYICLYREGHSGPHGWDDDNESL